MNIAGMEQRSARRAHTPEISGFNSRACNHLMRLGGLLGGASLLLGCAAAPVAIGMGLDAVLGAVGIYQRYEDRGAQREQTEQIKQLTEEVKALREVEKKRLEERPR